MAHYKLYQQGPFLLCVQPLWVRWHIRFTYDKGSVIQHRWGQPHTKIPLDGCWLCSISSSVLLHHPATTTGCILSPARCSTARQLEVRDQGVPTITVPASGRNTIHSTTYHITDRFKGSQIRKSIGVSNCINNVPFYYVSTSAIISIPPVISLNVCC